MAQKLVDKFGGEGAGSYNVVATALIECAKDEGIDSEYAEYEWLNQTPRTTLVVFLVDKIRELGFDIVPTTITK